MNLTLASIHIHPVKSLGGFAVEQAQLTDRGLEHDRRWMLVDAEGNFITQREQPELACLHTSPTPTGFRISDLRSGSVLDLPWQVNEGSRRRVRVWSSSLTAVHHAPADRWLEETLGRPYHLVYMPNDSRRRTDGRYARSLTSLSDGFPYLIVSQASLDELNARLLTNGGTAVPMDRFRPNLVVQGGSPFQEDGWRRISIGEVMFELVKPCARCVIVTTDQRTGERRQEPLRTLATFRRRGKAVLFGMNAVSPGAGTIRTGDLLQSATPE
jgi:uncharacterized protein